jgi:acetyltransferase-like isoleucine patch superfamily enzyme
MSRVVKYVWFRMVMWLTSGLPEFTPILKLRGALVRPCFLRCGRNLQIGSGTIINYPNRVAIGNDVFMANRCWIQGIGGVVLEDEAILGPGTVLATSNHTRLRGSFRFGPGDHGRITIGAGTWTGAYAVVTKGVTIGRGCAVGANAVVTQDVQDNALVGGVPARVLRVVED